MARFDTLSGAAKRERFQPVFTNTARAGMLAMEPCLSLCLDPFRIFFEGGVRAGAFLSGTTGYIDRAQDLLE